MVLLRKKEIVAAALVVMIGVAGYLNWSYQDTIKVTDGEIYTETGKRLGEAQYVSSANGQEEDDKPTVASGKDHFESAKKEKENARSKAMEILTKSAENENFDADTRKSAQERILKMAENVEKETTIENIAKAKGFSDIAVYIDGDMADIIVKKDDLSENDIIKLKQIATEQLNTGAQNVKIVQVK